MVFNPIRVPINLYGQITPQKKRLIFLKCGVKGKPEGIIRIGDHLALSGDGQVHTIDLIKKNLVIGENEGHLRIRFDIEPPSGAIDKYGKLIWYEKRNWRAELEVINGGIQPVADGDVYMNLAPESGYSSGPIEIGFNKNDSGYRKDIYNQRYYIKSNDNSYYAQITIDYRAILSSNKPELRYKGKLNPSGSRNLEYFARKY